MYFRKTSAKKENHVNTYLYYREFDMSAENYLFKGKGTFKY